MMTITAMQILGFAPLPPASARATPRIVQQMGMHDRPSPFGATGAKRPIPKSSGVVDPRITRAAESRTAVIEYMRDVGAAVTCRQVADRFEIDYHIAADRLVCLRRLRLVVQSTPSSGSRGAGWTLTKAGRAYTGEAAQ